MPFWLAGATGAIRFGDRRIRPLIDDPRSPVGEVVQQALATFPARSVTGEVDRMALT